MTAKEYKIKLNGYISLGGSHLLEKFKREASKPYPSKYFKEKLAWELRKLNLKVKKQQIKVASNPIVQTTVLHTIKPIDSIPVEQRFINAPYEVRLLRTQYAHLAKEQAAIKGRLRLIKPSERFAACDRIIEIGKEHDRIWDDIRSWQSTGKVPEVGFSKNVVQLVLEKHNRYKTLLTYISRYTKNLSKPKYSPIEKEKFQGYIDKYEIEIQQIRQELNIEQ